MIKAGVKLSSNSDSTLKPAGSSCIGCTVSWTFTDNKGGQHTSTVTQRYEAYSTRLSLPFVEQGLGRVVNYIENLSVGIPKKTNWFKFQSPIIPNSKLKVIVNNEDPSKWNIIATVNPSRAIGLIITFTIIFCIFLIIWILILHIMEKVEDRKDKKYFEKIRKLR